jgi:2-methylcitrate dehydratase PrpD
MDEITETIVRLIKGTDLTHREDLLLEAKRAFLDYLASLYRAAGRQKVKAAAHWAQGFPGKGLMVGQKGTSHPIFAAFYNGFASHYLDLDDAQSNIAGHFSTVLFSVLLSVMAPQQSVKAFLTAYVVGAELEGLMGSLVNPEHKWQGWHSTGTLGPLGGACALAKWANLDLHKTAQLLSLCGSQSGGLGLQAGSDGKPLHSGFAARNAVFAYDLVTTVGLSARETPFNPQTGWLKTFSAPTASAEFFESAWLKKGQILDPGLWMKTHPYCSAAICGEAACKKLWQQGIRLDDLQEIVFHFPPGADKALRYEAPETGTEGKFSMEYVAYQVLTQGRVEDGFFDLEKVPEAFTKALPRMIRSRDLPRVPKSVRRIVVTARTKSGEVITAEESAPPGSPNRPFTEKELFEKLALSKDEKWANAIMNQTRNWPNGTMESLWPLLCEE